MNENELVDVYHCSSFSLGVTFHFPSSSFSASSSQRRHKHISGSPVKVKNKRSDNNDLCAPSRREKILILWKEAKDSSIFGDGN